MHLTIAHVILWVSNYISQALGSVPYMLSRSRSEGREIVVIEFDLKYAQRQGIYML
ncbi:hypothetical protein RchiOBHm_Chr2g0158701 [Rosa chinensis]|uniref:Uncharacterized protein n=1 Tax=Rosa chinensis TaxID=74649 RepID=A0A2P6S232_ROSCH|nr:hypothetical protein RchiOBHm_Chr2g0158701 [Rosa chinensis]